MSRWEAGGGRGFVDFVDVNGDVVDAEGDSIVREEIARGLGVTDRVVYECGETTPT